MRNYTKLLDPTIPDKAEFVAGGKHAGLEEDLDALGEGLTGTPENQRAKFHDRIQALAKKRDLLFGEVHGMALARHPELRADETLSPTPFAPRLMTRTETAQAVVERDRAAKEAERKKAQKANATEGVYLVHGAECGWTFPIFPQD